VSDGGPALALRPERDEDLPFLRDLFAASRAAELDLLAFDAEGRVRFGEQQLAAQRASWARTHPDASFEIVLVGGVRAGRLVVDRTPSRIDVVDIALMPAFRDRGVGTRLIQALLGEADGAGVPVSLYADAAGRARRLYERLGFKAAGGDGVRVRLERPARRSGEDRLVDDPGLVAADWDDEDLERVAVLALEPVGRLFEQRLGRTTESETEGVLAARLGLDQHEHDPVAHREPLADPASEGFERREVGQKAPAQRRRSDMRATESLPKRSRSSRRSA